DERRSQRLAVDGNRQGTLGNRKRVALPKRQDAWRRCLPVKERRGSASDGGDQQPDRGAGVAAGEKESGRGEETLRCLSSVGTQSDFAALAYFAIALLILMRILLQDWECA